MMITQGFRIEKDSLGEVKVPEFALYGAQTQRAIENFPISQLRPSWHFIWSMVIIKRSAAIINNKLNHLDNPIMEAIVKACDEVLKGKHREYFVVDPFQAGAGTSHNMNVNEVIANRATQILGGNLGEYLVDPNDHVNRSQSTNDTIPTAIRIGALARLDEILDVIDRLTLVLHEKANEFDGIIKSGRTHLQDAVPVRLGQEFGAYATSVARDRERIKRAADTLRRLGIGGTAAGTGLNAPPKYHILMVKEISDFTGLQLCSSDNLFESMQSMADFIDFSSSLRTHAVTLTKIANDIRLLSSGPHTGLAEIRLPAVQPGSSIMPGKVNPVMAEMLNMAMYHIMGNDHTVALASQAGQLELNVMMPVIAHNLFEMVQILIGSIEAFTEKCLIGIEADQENAMNWLHKNPIIATALNPLIGYKKAAELVQYSIKEDLTIKEACLDYVHNGILFHKDSGAPITEEQITSTLENLREMTEGGLLG